MSLTLEIYSGLFSNFYTVFSLRLIDRLHQYLELKNVSPYNFERVCGIANGYLKKQSKGRGTIGSEILEKISEKYIDLSLSWLITGRGSMMQSEYLFAADGAEDHQLKEEPPVYRTDERTVRLLREKIVILENSLADKEKIIRLIEKQLP